jgi:feruloyl-CoA synthase
VVTTHGMLSANQQQIRQVWPFLHRQRPILVDWLPWSHTFGGSHNVNLVITNGGSLFIDPGRPTQEMIAESVRSIRDVRPTIYFNVPAGYASLIPILERDHATAARFFSRLSVAFFAAAAMPQDSWDRLGALARVHGSPMQLTTSWGMTETSPAATSTHFVVTQSNSIGVPLPGVDVKLAPRDGKYELSVRGPNVARRFLSDSELPSGVFDDEGYLRTGDAVAMVNHRRPELGLMYEGRLAENFKLASGTFVSTGAVRIRLISLSKGIIRDAVICGHDGPTIGAMVWLADPHADRVNAHGVPDEGLRRQLVAALDCMAEAGGVSQRVERLIILVDPPSLDAEEITDKGYINQRRVRENRAEIVAELNAVEPSKRTVVSEKSATADFKS